MNRSTLRSLGPIATTSLCALALVACTTYPSTDTGLNGQRPASAAPASAPAPATTTPRPASPSASAAPTTQLERVLSGLDDDTADYLQHIVTLTSPYFEGRAPGYPGNQRAADYIEAQFTSLGLEPAFPLVGNPGEVGSEPGYTGYQQHLTVNGETEVISTAASYTIAGETTALEVEEDFNPMAVATDGSATGEIVFVGYALDVEEKEYSSFGDADLTGKIALMMRFEPMDAQGKSLWTSRGGWSREASILGKIANCVERGAAGVILVSPPGADDPRAGRLETVRTSRWGQSVGVPMVMLSQKAAKRLVDRAEPEGRSLLDLRKLADGGEATTVTFDGTFAMQTDLNIAEIPTHNVGGVLRGSGGLADEWVIIGGHYDHIGYGFFGSRSPEKMKGTIHPGADDNASGTAGVLLAAKLLAEAYADNAGRAKRSVLFLGFTAEEMGLIGARHFAQEMTLKDTDVTAMLNLDMIGRVSDNELTIYGTGTAPEWDGLLARRFSGFEVNKISASGGRSDHAVFYRQDMPVLHIFSGLHDQYHRFDDTWPLVNFTQATEVARDVAGLALELAERRDQLAFTPTQTQSRPSSPRMGNMKVRLGIAPASYDEGQVGVPIGGVSPGTSAADAGLREGDVMTHWNGEELAGMEGLMVNLLAAEPDDVVQVTVQRGGESVDIPVKLKARERPQ